MPNLYPQHIVALSLLQTKLEPSVERWAMISKSMEHQQKFDILQEVGKSVAKKNFFVFITYPNW